MEEATEKATEDMEEGMDMAEDTEEGMGTAEGMDTVVMEVNLLGLSPSYASHY